MTGVILRRERMEFATSCIRRTVVNRDWSEAFNKLGYGNSHRPSTSHMQRFIPVGDIAPALPTLAEFADLISRPAHTEVTQRLHGMCTRAALDLFHASPAANPAAGAHLPLPVSAAASRISARNDYQHQDADDILGRFLHDQDHAPAALSGHGPARNFFTNKDGREVP